MMKLAIKCLLLIPVLLTGCATTPAPAPTPAPKETKPLSYAETLSNRPMPVSEAARNSECNSLSFEMNRQRQGLNVAAKMEPGSLKKKEILLSVQKNMDAIHARALKIGCVAPQSPATGSAPQNLKQQPALVPQSLTPQATPAQK